MRTDTLEQADHSDMRISPHNFTSHPLKCACKITGDYD